MCCDTSSNGRMVAFGTNSGNVFISNYDFGKDDEAKQDHELRKQLLKEKR